MILMNDINESSTTKNGGKFSLFYLLNPSSE